MTGRLFAGLLCSMTLLAQSPGEGISRDLARRRARQISGLSYRLSLQLAPDADRMPGHEEIGLSMATADDAPLILDFRDGSVSRISVNGSAVEAQLADGHMLIPGSYFTAGRNTIALAV
jgi:aminopeptidase N